MSALRNSLVRSASRHLKFATKANANLSKLSSTTPPSFFVATRNMNTLLNRKELGEETTYIHQQEELRQQEMRRRVDKILALEHDHEHMEELNKLLEKSESTAEKGLISKLGLDDWKFALPAALFIGIPVLSNEVLVLDAETQLVACFILFCSTMYTQVGGMVAKSLDDYSKQIEDDLKKVDTALFSQIQNAVDANSEALTLEEDFKQYYTLVDQLAVAQADVMNHMEEHKYRDAIVKKLDSLAALEESAVGAIRQRMLTAVKADVIATFSNDKKVKEDALNRAMEVLAAGATGKMGKDIVGEVFTQSLNKYKTEYATMAEGSDPILVQLEKDMQAVAMAPVPDGKGGNVFVA